MAKDQGKENKQCVFSLFFFVIFFLFNTKETRKHENQETLHLPGNSFQGFNFHANSAVKAMSSQRSLTSQASGVTWSPAFALSVSSLLKCPLI